MSDKGRASELVLTVPNNAAGERAIAHLRNDGWRDLRCEYVGSLQDGLRLLGLDSVVFVARLPHTFHLVRTAVGAEIATANRILQWHDGETEGRGRVDSAEQNVVFRLSALGTPFTLGGKHQDYLKQMRCGHPSSLLRCRGTPPSSRARYDFDGPGTAMTTLIHEVAPDAELSVVKATNASGDVTLWSLLAAIPIGAYDCKAQIINLSLGIHLSTKRAPAGRPCNLA